MAITTRSAPAGTRPQEVGLGARIALDEAIARTAKVDPQINAVVVKHYDYAERQIDKGLVDGPFTGVPFFLKDLDLLEGTRTTSGATVLKDFVADHSSTLTRRSRSGVARRELEPEFGLMLTTETRLFGPTRNPWIQIIPPAVRPAAPVRPLPHASCRWRTPATAAARSGSCFRLRRIRHEADPRAQPARPRSR